MAQSMTPSMKTMTLGQIDKAVANYRALLVKHQAELTSEAVQQVLGKHELSTAMLGVLRYRVEAISSMIVRRVQVDRTLTPEEAVDATGLRQFINTNSLATLPRGEGEEVELFLFKPDESLYSEFGFLGVDELEHQFELRGLEPDPRAQIALNAQDPTFAETRYNGAPWRDEYGKWHFVAFDKPTPGEATHSIGVDLLTEVYSSGEIYSKWFVTWWCAGVRK